MCKTLNNKISINNNNKTLQKKISNFITYIHLYSNKKELNCLIFTYFFSVEIIFLFLELCD